MLIPWRLPGCPDIVGAELRRVAGPGWCITEVGIDTTDGTWIPSLVLVVDRVNFRLRNTPSKLSLGLDGRWNDQCYRLSRSGMDVVIVPGHGGGKSIAPVVH